MAGRVEPLHSLGRPDGTDEFLARRLDSSASSPLTTRKTPETENAMGLLNADTRVPIVADAADPKAVNSDPRPT